MSLLREELLRAAMANFDSSRSLASSDTNAVDDDLQPYGSRLLPQVVNNLARSDPTRVYATFALSSDLSRGFRDITMLEIAQAINKLAGWIEMNIRRSTVFETIAYIGSSDLCYAILFLAAVKCGYKVSEAICYHKSLLSRTNICSFFYRPFAASLAISRISKNGIPEISFGLILPNLFYENSTVELMILLSDPMEKSLIPFRARPSF